MPHDELDRMCFVIFGIDFMQKIEFLDILSRRVKSKVS